MILSGRERRVTAGFTPERRGVMVAARRRGLLDAARRADRRLASRRGVIDENGPGGQGVSRRGRSVFPELARGQERT
ncbi:hypothetical protein [Dactylosporangium sp. CS-033363]|uniref:hypothetical protein n=1 Tax=Dactylosporangium sp. CS-033363 TaxID=3239935 RepID=UPI003D93F6AB